MDNEVYVGLDIGTKKVACVIAAVGESGGLEIIGVGKSRSDGVRDGVIKDIQKTVDSIRRAVEEAELMAGVDVEDVWVGIAGDRIKGINSIGYVATAHDDREVRQEDIDRAVDIAKAVQLPQEYEQLHVIPQEFCVDDLKDIKQPLGMTGVRLEAKVHIITAGTTNILNITKCVERAGLRLNKLVLNPLASSYAVLDKDEKKSGVALIDMGDGTMDIAIYHDDNLRHSSIIGYGGLLITRDIAKRGPSPEEKAEEVKKAHGCASKELVSDPNEILTIPTTGGRDDREITMGGLVEIIEARVEQLFGFARMNVENSGFWEHLGSGVVLTGGSSLMPGMERKATEVFGRPVRVGYPRNIGGLAEMVRDPMYATSVGLCMFGAEAHAGGGGGKGGKKKSPAGESWHRNFFTKLTSWFSKYF
jgi:cell division protein FtsA